MNLDRGRRRILWAIASGLLGGSALADRTLTPTPRQSAGPFYPVTPPLDDDSDLTRVRGRSGVAKGRPTDLNGRIVDLNARPVTGVRIEIWQCDANGRYRHPRDRRARPADANFQGHGKTVTDAEGRYRFRTIRPVPYPGRTPHIHMAVFPEGEPPFVTQLYVQGEARNAEDWVFNRVPADRRHLVVADFVAATTPGVELTAHFDIVLGGRSGTPGA